MSACNRSDRSRRVPSPTCFSWLAATLLPAAILAGERMGVEGPPHRLWRLVRCPRQRCMKGDRPPRGRRSTSAWASFLRIVIDGCPVTSSI